MDENDVYERITDFENIGYIFDYYKEEIRVKKCENCGKYIKAKNNKTKYCDECAKKIKLEQTRSIARESMRRLREQKRVRKSQVL